jgi:dienelactone hydrolase
MEIFHTRAARVTALCLAPLCLALGTAAAQVTDPAKVFSKNADYMDAQLSPTGEYVAVSTPFEDRRALSIIHLSGAFERSGMKFDAKELPFGQRWSDDNRLIVAKAKDYGRYGDVYATGDWFAVDSDAKNLDQIFGYVPDSDNRRARLKDIGSVAYMEMVAPFKGDALFYFMPYIEGNSKFMTNVFRVDTHTGSRKQVESFPAAVGVAADTSGTPRFTFGRDLAGVQVVSYRRTPDSAWAPAPAEMVGRSFYVWFFDPDNDHAYAQISDKGEPAALYRISTATGTREKLASHPTMEISDFEQAGRMGPPVVVSYAGGRPKVDYLDPTSEWAKLHAGLMKAFPGQMVQFVNVTRDENKLLFFAYSDRHPGAYYLFDRKTNTPQMLFETREWIDPAKMAPMAPIEFKNRGGETLYAFYTAPQGRQGKLPLVVMPHGGPFGIKDSWGYDNDAQFLASLGYAVLQVNYRGSGGRGDAFETSTYRQWGTGIQDDITDAVKHVVAQGLADPARMCIYGVSFGGYSAMMNPMRNPGMYKCAIAYAGVYDLVKLRSDEDFNKQSRAGFGREVGSDAAELAAQSPASQVAKLDVPILLIHGTSDTVAPFSQYRAAEAALAHANKPFESLVKPSEGHGFYKVANQEEAYRRMQAFLLKYNPPN